ncbi:MAG: NAD-dependent epimerase/dehydratase family protein [Polyangiaceae bacterium]|nr:NAD-dependent epimerase/dehydratase family protein [Polyangiaceae bacterium]
MSETVVVTGASGHVGAALVRALLAERATVRALVRSDVRALEGLDVERIKVDVTDRGAVMDALRGAEVVYHAAARVTLESEHDPAAERTNIEGTRNVLEGCRAHGVRRLVHFSTVHVLGDGAELVAEHPGAPYERSKAGAEREVQRAVKEGLDAVVVSPCAVIGPYDHKPSHMGKVLLMLAKGWLPATVAGGQSWVDVRDIAASSIAAAKKGEKGARYLLAGHWLPMREFATLASRAARVSPPRFSVPISLAKRFAPLAERASRWLGQEPLFTRASMDSLESRPRTPCERAAAVLGHAPRATEATLEDTFRWFEDAGVLKARRPS